MLEQSQKLIFWLRVLHAEGDGVYAVTRAEDGSETLALIKQDVVEKTTFEVGDEWQAFAGPDGEPMLARCAVPSLTAERRKWLADQFRWWCENTTPNIPIEAPR